MNTGWNLKLIYHFHVKSVGPFRRISLRAIKLFDCDDGNLFTQDRKRDLFDKQTNRLRVRTGCRIDEEANDQKCDRPAEASFHGGNRRKRRH